MVSAMLLTLLATQSPAEAAPDFPLVANGSFCSEPDCSPAGPWLPWMWVLYRDGTFDEGLFVVPNPVGTGTDGTWERTGADVLLINYDGWAYAGTLAAGCVDGDWASLPHDGTREGGFHACLL